jgi:uncharacterized protein YndB with AHSA1/START domain
MTAVPYVHDPSLDLVMERIVDVPPDLVWLAWTSPEHLKQWFCPRPWMTTVCDIDLRPGGKFRTVMRGPEGEEHDNTGCYLEVTAPSRLVWTGALESGFRPASTPDTSGVGYFTAIITIEPHGTGTKYSATVMHQSPEARQAHEAMGFHQGWGAAFEQLVEMARELQRAR